jgi:small-conductance mechanosensitive channel
MTAWLPPLRDGAMVLGVALVGYVLLLGAAHLLSRVRGLRFSAGYHLFAVSAALLAGVHLSHWPMPGRMGVLQHLTAVTLVLAVFPLAVLLNRTLWVTTDKRGVQIEAPRVLADLTTVILFTVAVLIGLQFIYDVQVPGLLAGSGVAALVLGLGMQAQLQNLFAGVALHLSKPFKTGDWLLIDGLHAKVIGISWRATRLQTNDDVVIEISNSEIVNRTVTNFHEPNRRHAVRTTIGLHYSAPPARVQQLLKQAAVGIPGVCATPSPDVFLKEFADSAVIYEIRVWIEDHAVMGRVLSDVRLHAWYAMRRAGIDIPYPQLTLHRAREEDTATATRTSAMTALQSHPIMGLLTPDQLEELVRGSTGLIFAPSERIIEEGDAGASLFLLVRGQVEVRIRSGDCVLPMAKLGPGECFGEMSLLAGEPRNATIVALTEVEAVEIAKPAFAAVVRAHPEIIGKLSELLAERQLANARQASAAAAPASAEQVRNGIGATLRAFFELGR